MIVALVYKKVTTDKNKSTKSLAKTTVYKEYNIAFDSSDSFFFIFAPEILHFIFILSMFNLYFSENCPSVHPYESII